MTPIKDALERIAPAVEQLACHQTQLDQDGVMVGVSRQAIDEVVNAINEIAISITTPAPGRDELRERIARLQRDILMYIDAGCPDDDIGYIVKVSHINFVQWYDALDAILSALPVAPVVAEAGIRADAELLDALIAADGLLQELGHSLPQVKAAIRAGGGER